MSTSDFHDQNNNGMVGPYGNSSGSFASLDDAFAPSLLMSDFQKKMMKKNPLMSTRIDEDCDVVTTLSEKRLNNNVDEMVERSFAQADAIMTPNLMENFNIDQQAQNIVYDLNTKSVTGMTILKWILIIILVACVLYVIYCMFKSGQTGAKAADIEISSTARPTITIASRNFSDFLR